MSNKTHVELVPPPAVEPTYNLTIPGLTREELTNLWAIFNYTPVTRFVFAENSSKHREIRESINPFVDTNVKWEAFEALRLELKNNS